MSERGALTNGNLRVMQYLWPNPAPSYHSRRWNFDDLRSSPSRCSSHAFPSGLAPSPGSRRRDPGLGDGWHPSGLTPEEYAAGRRFYL